MASASEKLRETIESLSETEAAKALDYIRSLRREQPNRALGALLSGDPSIHLPAMPYAPLPPIEPVHGSGIPASELLIRDRR
jgi:hypothetical protein